MKIAQCTLKAIWNALNRPIQSKNIYGYNRIIDSIIRNEWMFSHDFESLLYYSDNRLTLSCDDLDALIENIAFKWTLSLKRPSSLSRTDLFFKGMNLSETASLLMFLEACGFDIDASPLIKIIRPNIVRKKILTMAEVDVFRCEQRRNKLITTFKANDINWDWGSSKEGKLQNGYKFKADFQKDGEISTLTIIGPKHRNTKPPELTTCKECGHSWLKGDPAEGKIHREIHKHRMSIIEPQFNENMAIAFRTENDPEVVDYMAPEWKQNEILDRAFAFKREMHFDFVQWSKSDPDFAKGKVVGFLLTNENKAIVGAICFRERKYKNEEVFWELDWAWIAPKFRRSGILRSRWPYFRERFGDFYVSHPISKSMKNFLNQMNDGQLALFPSER